MAAPSAVLRGGAKSCTLSISTYLGVGERYARLSVYTVYEYLLGKLPSSPRLLVLRL